MSEIKHCVVNGKQCSKCCEVLTMRESKNFRDWQTYVRRNGYPADFNPEMKVYHLVRKISKRRAKKVNRKLVERVGGDQSYWTCKNFTGEGCSDYLNRPSMCSGYPYYGKTVSEWFGSDEFKRGPLYHEDCTFYIKEIS